MSEKHSCLKTEKFKAMEDKIQINCSSIKALTAEMKEVQEERAETRVYVKQIFDRIDDLKVMFVASNKLVTESNKQNAKERNQINKAWQPVVIELIKMIGIIAAVIAGIKLMG